MTLGQFLCYVLTFVVRRGSILRDVGIRDVHFGRLLEQWCVSRDLEKPRAAPLGIYDGWW